MIGYVIDASVALKWLIPEDGSAAAEKLLSVTLAAPDLLGVECVNALWKKHRLGELSATEAELCADLLAKAPIELVPSRALLGKTLRLALA